MFSTRKLYIFTCIHSIILLKITVNGSIVFRLDDSSDKEPLSLKTIYSKKLDDRVLNNAIPRRDDNDYGSISDVLEYALRNVDRIESNGKLNRRLVKKIIPHRYEPSKYEYDRKLNTFYKPLIRIHKRKPFNVYQNIGESNDKELNPAFIIHNYKKGNLRKNNKQVSNVMESLKHSLSQLFDINTNIKIKENILKTNKESLEKAISELFHINTQIEKNGNTFNTNKGNRNVMFNILLDKRPKANNVQVNNNLIRQIYNKIMKIISKRRFYQLKDIKSGEEYQPEKLYVETTITEPPKVKRLPSYSFWNYWTYDKTLHEDDCEGNLIKFNNVCIGAHYK